MLQIKTRKEIARELGIHPKTLSRWLKVHNIEVSSGLLTPVEQNRIYAALGFVRVNK